MAWDPEQYVLGNYFQTKINEQFRKTFSREPTGTILDVGCGDGQYTRFLAGIYPKGRILGIDSSAEMIEHATHLWASNNLSFAVHRIEDFQPPSMFDFVLSFWCLHWTNIAKALPNIFQALKMDGRLYAVLSSFSDNSILQIWHELAEKKGRYSDLANTNIQNLQPYVNYFYRVLNILAHIPFRHIKLDLHTVYIDLPDISYLKNLILALPLMGQVPKSMQGDLLDEMLNAFEQICQRKYKGKLYYETRPVFLEAEK